VFTALEQVDLDTQAHTVFLDSNFKMKSELKSDITDIYYNRDEATYTSIEDFAYNLREELENVRIGFEPHVTEIENDIIFDLGTYFTDLESALLALDDSSEYTDVINDIITTLEGIKTDTIANLDSLVADLAGTFTGLDDAITAIETEENERVSETEDALYNFSEDYFMALDNVSEGDMKDTWKT
jgi:hypothetical protein